MSSTEAVALDKTDFRVALAADIDSLADLYKAFFHESDLPTLGLVFSPGQAHAWVTRAVTSGYPLHILAVDKADGRVVGAIDYYLDTSGTTAPFAYLDKFYVLPEWRQGSIGGTLVDLAMAEAKADGAIAFRAGLSSGMSAARRLFAGKGFAESVNSTLLARRL